MSPGGNIGRYSSAMIRPAGRTGGWGLESRLKYTVSRREKIKQSYYMPAHYIINKEKWIWMNLITAH